MKNIMLLKWSLSEMDGGVKVAVELSNELAKEKDFQVHLVSISGPLTDNFQVSDQVTYAHLSGENGRLRQVFFPKLKQLKKYIKDHQIDVILVIGAFTNLFGVLSTLFTGTKVVLCEHVNAKVPGETKGKQINRRIGSKLADKVITLTPKDRDNFKELYHVPDKKIDYIYNWYNNQVQVRADLSSQKLVTVGRINYQKGLEYLIQVADKVLKDRPDWTWEIFGNGEPDYLAELKSKLAQLNLQDRVIFKGVSKNYQEIYGDKSIYVMTSRYEGLPLVLLEAQTAGLPIVSFDCQTGPSEIVADGLNGDLVDCFDVDELSQRLAALMDDQELREAYSKKSHLNRDKFDKEKILGQWKNLIEDLT